jgi:ectoine hydroxylase-related dioxygenase (phytanoyl-CoA dioxygenase family)
VGIPRLGPDATPDAISAALLDRGCVIVERLAPPELCDRVETELAPWSARTPVGGDEFTGRNTRRTGALLARVPSSVELIAHPRVLEVCDRVLGRKGARYQLHLTQAIAIGPGSPAQQLHRDHWCFDFHRFPVDLDVEVSTIWALCDFDEANGATRVIPDTHRLEGLEYDHADSLAAEMPRGSVVLYLGGTVHGGGANRTEAVRTGINVDYTLGWLRQEENQYLSVPREVAAALPERVQRLMGYDYGAYALGYVDDARDPITVLHPERGGTSSFAMPEDA